MIIKSQTKGEFQEKYKLIILLGDNRFRIEASINDGLIITKTNDEGTDAIVIKPIVSNQLTIE